MRKAALLLVLASCIPLSFSGSNVPTDSTFLLSPKSIEAAERYVEICKLDWITNDPERNVETALQKLDERGVTIIERRKADFATALRRKLLVNKGFFNKRPFLQAVTLTHELVHYCERDDLGNEAFDNAYGLSAGRWVAEVPATAQALRTAIKQGATPKEISTYIDAKLISLKDFYWLHSIEPTQYLAETSRIWATVAP